MDTRDLLRLNRLQKVVGTQRYAKLAADQSHSDSVCPASYYADVKGQKYPCHTKLATYESSILAADDQVTDQAVTEQLTKLAAFWGIEADVKDAIAKVAETKLASSPAELGDEEYALIVTSGDAKIRKFASYDSESLLAAAEAFYAQRKDMPFSWRKTASENLLKAASVYGTVLPAFLNDYLLKAACVARPTMDSIDEGIVQRMNLTHKRDEDVMSKISEVLNKVAQAPSDYDSATLAEIFDAVDQADRTIKLANHYATGRLDLPEEMLVVSRQVKTASTAIRLTNGQVVDVSKLTKEALATVDEGLAEMSLAKLAEVLPTLPVPDANLLMRMHPKCAADVNALTDDNFAAQTAPAAMAAAPTVAPAGAMAPAGPTAPSKMMDPAMGAGASKMAPVASGAAAGNFAANGSNMPTNAGEQQAMNTATNAGQGAMLGTPNAPIQ